MHILLIAHYFPPDGGGGCQRPASFAQHLPQLGVDTTVVCRQVEEVRRGMYDPTDSTLLARVTSAQVLRASVKGSETWSHALLRKAREVMLAQRHDIAIVTLSPFEHATIGFALRKEFGIPVVLDLRDPWALDGWYTYRHYFAWRHAYKTMLQSLEAADGVVMNVPEARLAAEKIAPRKGKYPYGVVLNGWEETDFTSTSDIPVGDVFRIRFAGTFLSRFVRDRQFLRRIRARFRGRGEVIDERGRSPLFLLEAIRRLREDPCFRSIGNDFRLEIAGAREPETLQIIEESGCSDIVEMKGYLPHDESTRFISGAHALLLPMHGLPQGARARMVPGKLYEYFGTGRPILGFCPEGDARDWIVRDPRSRVADPVDPDAIAKALCEMHLMWRAGELVHSRRAPWTQEFTRESQARHLVDYLFSVVDSVSAK